MGSLASTHSPHPAFISLHRNPSSANRRAALAERCQVWFQQYVTSSFSLGRLAASFEMSASGADSAPAM